MNEDAVYRCPGCALDFLVGPAEGRTLHPCPNQHCGRQYYGVDERRDDGKRFLLGIEVVPDLTKRFATDGMRLLVDGQELLCGPVDEIRMFAAALNESDPAMGDELQDAVRELMQQTRGCSFAPGPALRLKAAAGIRK